MQRQHMRHRILPYHTLQERSNFPETSKMTSEGEKFIVVQCDGGWVEAESRHYTGKIPLNVKLFESKEDAIKFAQRWQGHPWWCKPNGNFQVYKVKPKTEPKIIGWEIIDDNQTHEKCI